MRKLLTRGNHKLPRSIGIFNLPHRTTCPGATEWCKQHCYARKAERMYKQVIPYRELNYKLSKQDNFVELVNNELAHSKLETVRIHESGDFYNQAYLDKWTEIAKANPTVRFTFYTKSFHLLDFSKIKRLNNVNAFASLDPTSTTLQRRKAKSWVKAFILCGEEDKECFTCPGSCKSCTHCYNKTISDVGFRPH